MKAMLAYECVKQLVAQENADEAIKYTLGWFWRENYVDMCRIAFFRVEWSI